LLMVWQLVVLPGAHTVTDVSGRLGILPPVELTDIEATLPPDPVFAELEPLPLLALPFAESLLLPPPPPPPPQAARISTTIPSIKAVESLRTISVRFENAFDYWI
jgi:hypothetical protein